MPINKIGNLLKQERIKANMSLVTLSKLSNISISTISKIENDKIKKINSVFIYRICKILKIDYQYINRKRWDLLPVFLYDRKKLNAQDK